MAVSIHPSHNRLIARSNAPEEGTPACARAAASCRLRDDDDPVVAMTTPLFLRPAAGNQSVGVLAWAGGRPPLNASSATIQRSLAGLLRAGLGRRASSALPVWIVLWLGVDRLDVVSRSIYRWRGAGWQQSSIRCLGICLDWMGGVGMLGWMLRDRCPKQTTDGRWRRRITSRERSLDPVT